MLPLYLIGMVGYLLALPFRIMISVKEIFSVLGALFLSLFRREFSHLRVQSLYLLGALAEAGSASVGALVPPLAYFMDEAIQNNEAAIPHRASCLGTWLPIIK